MYTESLFLFLAMLLCLGVVRRRVWLVCLSGCLLPLARPVGIILILPCAWQVAERLCFGIGNDNKGSKKKSVSPPPPEPSSSGSVKQDRESSTEQGTSLIPLKMPTCAIVAILAGYAAYFCLMYQATGDPFAGFKAQQGYPNAPSVANIFNIKGFAVAFLKFGSFHAMLDSVINRLVFVVFLATLPGIWRLNRTYFVYSLAIGLVPAMSSWFISYARHIELCFPAFIYLAVWFEKAGNRWLLWYYLGILSTLQGISSSAVLLFDGRCRGKSARYDHLFIKWQVDFPSHYPSSCMAGAYALPTFGLFCRIS